MNIEELGNTVIGAAIKVHRTLGPGLLESAYQKCLDYELRKIGLRVECELALPIQYEAVRIDVGYRIDMIVEELIIIENKTVERLLPIHEAQLLTYLKMRGCRLGYLLNWNVPMLRDGIKRLVNNL
jgi:GxxExxY protein